MSKPARQSDADASSETAANMTAPEVNQGDNWEAVFAEHQQALGHFLLGVLKDKTQVQDSLQSTFIRLVEKGESVKNKASMKGWLFRVAYNEAMMVRRREAVAAKHTQKLAWQIDLTSPESESPDAAILQTEMQQRVAEALETLSPQQLAVVRKRIYQGLKFREIAEELNVPLGTVLARMQSSLKKLKTVLHSFQKEN